jgi:hypothetical protein
VRGVDHGLTFNLDEKLRTVLWGWSGRRLPGDVLEALDRLVADLEGGGETWRQLSRLLDPPEVERTALRARRLREAGRHPRPGAARHPIPWPAF